MSQQEEGLKREIGVLGLSANMVNIIVGAGIFTLPAIVAAGLGNATMVAYVFCGFLVILIMLCFAEVGSRITSSGGVYTYLEVAFGRFSGFIIAVIYIISCIAADAAISGALINILGTFHPFFKGETVRILFLIILFGGFATINVIGVKQGIGLVKLNTTLKLLPLVILAIIGWKDVEFINLTWEGFPSISDLGQTSLILFFAFQGAETGLSVSGEVKNPQKTIPRAILLGIFGTLLLYMMLQTVSQGVLGKTIVNFTENPLGEVANVVFGPIGLTLILIGGLISMFGSISGELLNNPRVIYGAARDRVVPVDALAKIHPKFATPYIAIIFYAVLALTMSLIGGFAGMVQISNVAILIIYLGIALAVLKLRTKDSFKNKPGFTIPYGPVVPILAIVTIVWLLSNLTLEDVKVFGLTLILLSLTYFIIRRKQ